MIHDTRYTLKGTATIENRFIVKCIQCEAISGSLETENQTLLFSRDIERKYLPKMKLQPV